MPRCRCRTDCALELSAGTPVVQVSFFGKPTQPMLVALEHLMVARAEPALALASPKEDLIEGLLVETAKTQQRLEDLAQQIGYIGEQLGLNR